MSIFGEIFGGLWEVWKEMFSVFWNFFKKFIILLAWVLLGVFILPCVFVAGVLYPIWTEWGEEL